jgi:PAS domain-containing protein
VLVEMDDSRSQQELRAKQWRYAGVLAVQLAVSLLLIVLLLKRRLLAPLRSLTGFSDRLSRGDFDTPLVLSSHDELGAWACQMDRMRLAIRELFADIGRREERFRTIVTQVPGAVFRARPGGAIDFVSDAIQDISGYPARLFMSATTDAGPTSSVPEDRRMQRRLVKEAVRPGVPTRSNTGSSMPTASSAGCWRAASRWRRAATPRSGSTASSPTSATASTTRCASRPCWPNRARCSTT